MELPDKLKSVLLRDTYVLATRYKLFNVIVDCYLYGKEKERSVFRLL